MKLLSKYFFSLCLFIFLICTTIFINITYSQSQAELSSKVIRLHVRANSNSYIDQNLKMQVKNNVVEYIYENTKDITSKSQMRDFITSNLEKIKTIARKTVSDNGFYYSICADIDYSYFPLKKYGDYTFPNGVYEALIIEIGSGNGHNWWCVLYPPLCFIDASTAVVPDSSKEILDEDIETTKYEFKYLKFLNKFF